MTEEELQQIADNLKNFKGRVKGEIFRTHADYIKSKEGEDGIKKVEEKMAELGVPINFSSIKSFDWFSEGLSSLTIVVAKEIFNWTEEDVFEMGRFAPKFSFIIKVMIQYLASIDTLFENTKKYWDKHFDFGYIETSLDKEKKQMIVKEYEFNTHPLSCVYHAGYFKGLCEFAVKSKDIKVKYTYQKNGYNEYIIVWN